LDPLPQRLQTVPHYSTTLHCYLKDSENTDESKTRQTLELYFKCFQLYIELSAIFQMVVHLMASLIKRYLNQSFKLAWQFAFTVFI